MSLYTEALSALRSIILVDERVRTLAGMLDSLALGARHQRTAGTVRDHHRGDPTRSSDLAPGATLGSRVSERKPRSAPAGPTTDTRALHEASLASLARFRGANGTGRGATAVGGRPPYIELSGTPCISRVILR